MATIVRMRDEWNTPPPVPIHIRKGASQLADQESPSFLTTLPPEIRNEVYRWLLVREEPIIYDGCHSDREREPSIYRDYRFDQGYDYDEIEAKSLPLSEEELRSLREPSHDIGSCVPFLRSCRQIYFEAVGILYSANSFLISANLHQHNEKMNQISTAADFLVSLGTQLDLLKKLVIDITPLCPEECADGIQNVDTEQIDILPIIRVLWSQPKVAQVISLTSTGRNLDRRVHPFYHEDDLKHSIRPRLLNGIIQAIGRNDTLNLMRYGRFERLLSNIWVRRNLDWGWIVHPIPSYQTYPRGEAEVVQTFDIIRSPKSKSLGLEWGSWEYSSKLHMLPLRIQVRIRTCASRSEDNILFDLDRQTVHGLEFGPLHLNREFRRSMHQQAANGSQMTVAFATNEVRTDFSDYANLRRWLEHPISKVYPTSDRLKISSLPPRIALNFNIEHSTALADIQVDVTNFIRLTYDLLPQSMVLICIKTNHGEIRDEHAVSLEDIRKRCFLYISEIMENFPLQSCQKCPELWINGYGTVLGAFDQFIDLSQQGGYRSNSYAKLDDTDLLEIGREYATNLERRPAPMLPAISYTSTSENKSPNAVRLQRWAFPCGRKPNQALRECDDLRSMWISLKGLDWFEQRHDIWDDPWSYTRSDPFWGWGLGTAVNFHRLPALKLVFILCLGHTLFPFNFSHAFVLPRPCRWRRSHLLEAHD
jgi:hypothetical protein